MCLEKMKSFYLIVILLVCFAFSCSHTITRLRPNEYVITDRGLPNILEVGMDHSALKQKGLKHYVKPGHEVAPYSQKFYVVPSLSAEFELKNNKIHRIWFFAEKHEKSPVQFPLNGGLKMLSSISADDIISSFGDVNVFLTENPEKNENKPYWVKYDPFKVGLNYIVYPDYPYLFFFDRSDMLSSITVSLEND
ncbi:hypothetical protein ES705_47203 [subsurface metagenome]